MQKIEIDTYFGDKPEHIEVAAPHGAASVYHVTINNYFNGQLVKTERFGWQIYLNTGTTLQGDDVSVILGLIEENLVEQN